MSRPTFRTDGVFAIHVPDLDQARAFYGDLLGFELLEQSASRLVFDTGSFILYVVLDDEEVMPYIPALRVPSLGEAVDYLQANGLKMRRDFGSAAYFEDPFGIVFDIIEE
jgi:catechol 2,3-dioxygenase-like lactoylglutathione lyase family enzyme